MSELTAHLHRYLVAEAVAEMLAIHDILRDFEGACSDLEEAVFAIRVAAIQAKADELVSRALLLAAARYFGWQASV